MQPFRAGIIQVMGLIYIYMVQGNKSAVWQSSNGLCCSTVHYCVLSHLSI